jgi:hypothetical protein
MKQPRISQLRTWENYKANIFIVIREALWILQARPDLPDVEAHSKRHSLNRELHKCFVEACRQRALNYHLPTPEAKNTPYKDDQHPTERENKIPDFQWSFVDHLANPEFCERHFVLECKRLGTPSSSNWKLNENYVLNGICRFLTSPHEYGKGDDACAMVGYVQNMTFDEILDEVNQTINASTLPIAVIPDPKSGWQEMGITELEHTLERSFPVSPFQMYHFWVDIRRENG